jgi:hypothetical protein
MAAAVVRFNPCPVKEARRLQIPHLQH